MTYKKYTDYTDQELLDLYTGEDWENFFEFQCALDSIPFLPAHYGPEPAKITKQKDITAWSVGGIKFKNKEDAEKVFGLITSMDLVDDVYKQSNVYVLKELNSDDYSYPKLSSSMYYTKELYEEIKPDLLAYKERFSAWEKVKNNYNEVAVLREDLLEQILVIIRAVERKNNQYAEMQSKYTRYIELSNGDKEVALNFLRNSCPSYKEDFPEFFEANETKTEEEV